MGSPTPITFSVFNYYINPNLLVGLRTMVTILISMPMELKLEFIHTCVDIKF